MKKPKFKVGQVVYWRNGKERYCRITEILPIHCPGGCQSYYVRANDELNSVALERYASAFPEGPVAEDVLRPLSVTERGVSLRR